MIPNRWRSSSFPPSRRLYWHSSLRPVGGLILRNSRREVPDLDELDMKLLSTVVSIKAMSSTTVLSDAIEPFVALVAKGIN